MEDLIALAVDNPPAARRRAEQVLAARPDAAALSTAHQCLGIVARDEGRTGPALAHFRKAMRAAEELGSPDRHHDIRASYGVALFLAGRTRAGLVELDAALRGSSGELAARVGMRKANVLAVLGRHGEARPVISAALRDLAGKDDLWEARGRICLADIEINLGDLESAEREVRAADRLFAQAGATGERVGVLENLAEIAVARGDVATGLRHYAGAEAAYAAAGLEPPDVMIEVYAAGQLAAGLADEAVALLERRVRATGVITVDRADLLLQLASAHLSAGDPRAALDAAVTARTAYRRQHRDWFELRARLVTVRAHASAGTALRKRGEVVAVATALHEERAHEAPLALVLAGGLLAAAQGVPLWEQAASYRRHPNALVRAAAWHARSLAGEAKGDRGGVLRAAASGLDAIDEHRRLIGSSELRALATTHGRELTTIALRHAATDPRTLLRWSERTRATALAQPPATSDAATIPAPLAALRDNGRRLAEARQEGEATDALERERRRLERAVRAESHTLSASADEQRPPAADEVVAAVGDGCLVELVDVDGVLHVLVVHDGRVRRRIAGTTAEVAALLGPAGMLLRRISRGRAADTTGLGRQLQDAVLGEAAGLLPDGPVVLAPTARLHGLAWSLLPSLADRPFSVVPSAGQWLRASATPRPPAPRRRTILVSGPGLATGGAEVPVLADRHVGAALLTGPDATLEQVLAQLDGADLVHLAAHGHFRADSPLFSSLDLADGPLTVHDLERVRRAPYRVVLSACESGVLAPVGAEELLGLASALFSLGTAGLVSSVAEVNDAATADLMLVLHDALAAGKDPATALLDVRRAASGDPVAPGTAAAFLALGV
ncbi:hypothetical protein ASE01_14630 [Nocardioides sp. Root190]|uniref:CHAT domain-containing protein n=1 Tax=Nocardioides sp. Root190 TaxID=1736488 RepID=UPI0006FBCBB5|nr:CHAT domain-containing protein [Nocardioides sp. Root190]KRB76241.1 hypothetical protein ASE01_14630 [Nocardioides sp. Root190]